MRLKKIITLLACLAFSIQFQLSLPEKVQSQQPNSETTSYEVGLNYLNNKNYVQAVKYFKLVIE